MGQGTHEDHRARFKREFGKGIRGPFRAIRHTTRHTSLLMVKLHLAGEEVEELVDRGASTSVVGKRLANKLERWKRVRKVKDR